MSVVINGTTGISGTNGSAGTPAIQGEDTNTGMFFPAADTIAFAEGGVESMRLTSAGNVGIGTSSPGARLHVQDTEANVRIQGSSGTYSLGVASSGGRFYLFDNVASAERLTVTSTGNLQFNSGYGSVATAYGCRAWVNFNGSGTVAIRASGNVSSITDNGTGDYTVNFTTAMPDTNYCFTGAATYLTGTSSTSMAVVSGRSGFSPTTSALRVITLFANGSPTDCDIVNVAVFR